MKRNTIHLTMNIRFSWFFDASDLDKDIAGGLYRRIKEEIENKVMKVKSVTRDGNGVLTDVQFDLVEREENQ